jgi:LysM repeat protein
MKRILFLLATAALFLSAAKNPRQAYIDRYYPLAVQEMLRTGVPASITLAQALLESGAGLSPLATRANNHFGMKCHNDWTGEKFYQEDDRADDCFRVYPSVTDSYRAHSDFLRNRERYKTLFDLDPTDYRGWAKGLRRAGYATDPNYANKLITLIEDFELYRYDEMTDEDIPFEVLVAVPEETKVKEAPAEEPVVVVPPQTVREEPAPRQPETVLLSLTREVFTMNDVRYVRAIEGETWASLAAEYHFSLKQLLRFNDLDAPVALQPGTVVYLERKKAQAEPGYGKYEVERDGMTLWDISQMFGIQLAKLRLYNAFRGDAPLEAGDTVLLRKF